MSRPGHALLASGISAVLGLRVAEAPTARVHGGSINECWRWASERGDLFLKLAPRRSLDAFDVEAQGLSEIARTGAVRVPRVLGVGVALDRSFLALEWIERGATTPAAQQRLGERLAALHRCTATRYGWKCDGFIGRTRQPNAWHDEWIVFFREQRLRHQLELAARNGLRAIATERAALLLEHLAHFIRGDAAQPALVHGDLWGGNWLTDDAGEPVLFDPAPYYGDREVDIAMTRLFGGFDARFYDAYSAAWPLAPGFEARCGLYNLYHILNHANLFGGSYVREAQALIDQLLAEAGH